MFKQVLSYSLFAAVLACGVLLGDTSLYEPKTGSTAEVDAFEKKMDAAIARAEQDVKAQLANATRHDMAPTWNTKLEAQNAIVQLEVKKTLVGNFKGTESLKSPAVRELLLQILNKPLITTGDLADLQSLVLQEKAKLKAAAQAQSQSNGTPASPVQTTPNTNPNIPGSDFPPSKFSR
jgi:hypothetical protein